MVGCFRFRVFASALAVCLALPALADATLRTHVAQIDETPELLARQLSENLPADVSQAESQGVWMLAYSGVETPQPLTDFLTAALPNLDPALLAKNRPVSLSVALVPRTGGTELRLIFSNPEPGDDTGIVKALGPELPEGTEVILNDGASGTCKGQVVLSHDAPMDEALTTFAQRIAARGYTVTDASDAAVSFLVGNGPDCSFFVYIQPDPQTQQRSVVVVRYLED